MSSSTNMIGSRLHARKGDRLSSQNAVAGLTLSLKVTRNVWFPASMNALPVFQSIPTDGSAARAQPAWLNHRRLGNGAGAIRWD